MPDLFDYFEVQWPDSEPEPPNEDEDEYPDFDDENFENW